MDSMKVKFRIVVLLLLLVSSYVVWTLPQQVFGTASTNLQVHFLDVGQGDAILIQTPKGVEVLIDGGRNASVLQKLAEVMTVWDRDIDMIVGTHPDTDHIGGLTDVLKNYTVGTILTTENEGDSSTADLYRSLSSAEGAEIIYARRGQEFALDASTTLRVLFPDVDPSAMETNTSSIVLQLQYGNSTFMLTGDSPKNIEEYLVLIEGEYLKSDVLKVGHHGSRTSTSELFLDEVQPQFAIISAGKDNSYGHPHVEVTDLLFNKRVQMFNTAEEGTITLLSDGTQVWKQ